MFPHRGNRQDFIEPRLFLAKDPQFEQVHPISGRNDRVTEKVDQRVVQLPIHLLGLRDQIRGDPVGTGFVVARAPERSIGGCGLARFP